MNKELLVDDILKEKASNSKLSLPKELNIKIKETLNGLPDRKKKSYGIARKSVVASAILIITLTGLSAAFPAYARSMPVVGSVFQFLSDKNVIDKEYVKYSSDVNLSKTSNDTTVTINSIAYDGIDLSIAYTFESKKEIKGNPSIQGRDFKINDKSTSFSSGGTVRRINKNTYVGVDNFSVSNEYIPENLRKNILGGDVKIPDNFIMDLNINEFSDGTKGNWDFKFKVSIDNIKTSIKTVNTSIELPQITHNLKVKEVVFTPMNTIIRSEADNQDLSGELGRYIVLDDKGRGLTAKHSEGFGSADTKKMYWQDTFRNVYEDSKSVTFIPIVSTKQYNQKVKSSNGGSRLDTKESLLNLDGFTTLSEGRYGDYKISKVEVQQGKTLIYYECTKFLPTLEPYGLIIKDESGKEYNLGRDSVKDLGDNKFVAEMKPLDKAKKYMIIAADLEKIYDVREDLKFTINVK